MTILLRCGCTSEYQDRRYGHGLRVHNAMKKTGMYRCTVCAREREG